MAHKGLHEYRLPYNPLEKKYADAWKGEQANGLLEWILGDGSKKQLTVTPRDEEVAATIIQWLGSPVGQCFVRDVLATRKPGE